MGAAIKKNKPIIANIMRNMHADIGNLFELDWLITETNCTFFHGKVHQWSNISDAVDNC